MTAAPDRVRFVMRPATSAPSPPPPPPLAGSRNTMTRSGLTASGARQRSHTSYADHSSAVSPEPPRSRTPVATRAAAAPLSAASAAGFMARAPPRGRALRRLAERRGLPDQHRHCFTAAALTEQRGADRVVVARPRELREL